VRRAGSELTLAAVQRRYVGLTALRWLPLGITVPVMVLLAAARGLSAAEIGLVMAVHSIVALSLELPTGGLADAIGHRPVLTLSVLLSGAGLLTMAAAHSVAAFALAYALIGAGRALDSGPLESWFVDAAHQADPDADLTRGLSRAAAANGGGLALGAVLGGLAPALASGAGSDVLAVPFLLAAGIDVVYLVAVLALVVRLGPRESARTGLLTGVREVPRIVRDTGRLVRADRILRRLLAIGFLIGVVLSALELMGPLRFASLAGSETEGTAVFGVVMAVSFGAAALGSVLAGPARRIARGSIAAATSGLAVLAAIAVVATALSPAVLPAAVTYALFYLANAAGWPLRQQLMHSRVPAAQRNTSVSVASFVLQTGAVAGSLLVPRLAEATSPTVGFTAMAAALVLSGLISLRLHARIAERPSAEPVAGFEIQASNAVG
jgi:MFS family permease